MDNKSKLLNYLPKIISDVGEYQQITLSEDNELNDLWKELWGIVDNFFILFADEYGVARYEDMLNIKPKDTESLEDRRYRIFTMLSSKLPYTFKALDKMLNTLTDGSYSITLNSSEYELVVRIGLDQKSQYNAVEQILVKWIPANMVVDLSLLYNKYVQLEPFTYGSLKNKTFKQIREEEL